MTKQECHVDATVPGFILIRGTYVTVGLEVAEMVGEIPHRTGQSRARLIVASVYHDSGAAKDGELSFRISPPSAACVAQTKSFASAASDGFAWSSEIILPEKGCIRMRLTPGAADKQVLLSAIFEVIE